MSSTQRPLARACLNIEAMIALAHEVAEIRTDKPKQQAQEFLDGLLPERLLALGLLADTGDEVAALVRFFDTSGYDLSAVPSILSAFVARADVLFVQGKIFSTPSSFVSRMMQLLEKSRVLVKTSTGLRVLGGARPELLRCRKEMAAWAALALKQLQVRPLAQIKLSDLESLRPSSPATRHCWRSRSLV